MRIFRYEAFDTAGRRIEGQLEAMSRDGALSLLNNKGLYPTSVVEAAGAQPRPWWQLDLTRPGPLSTAHLAVLTRELATLSSAQLPIDTVLEITSLQPMLPTAVRATVREVLQAVTEGTAFHAALARTARFPEAYWRLVEAGEASGSLSGVLTALAADLERQQASRAAVRGALAYPAFLMLAAIGTVGVIGAVLLPAMAPLFENAGQKPPAVIGWLLSTQQFFSVYAPLVGGAFAFAVLALAQAYRQETVRRSWHGLLLALPLIGPLLQQAELGRFGRSVSTMLIAGVPILDALGIARRAQSNTAFAASLEPAVDPVAKGSGLADALRLSGRFTDLALRLISVGEQTGQLETMLTRVATIYETAFERDLKLATSMIAPVLTLVIGVVVGGLMLSVMQALSSFNDLALR